VAVLAGLFGPRDAQFLRACCDTILTELRQFGSGSPQIRAFEDVALGHLGDGVPAVPGQPLSEDDRWLMVADARLDNAAELARLLDCQPSELTDEELLFRSWRRWGNACIDRLVGDYAFAAVDRAERKITLARDPTGQLPLYYIERDGLFAFASMPAGLAALMPDCRPNVRQLIHDLALIPSEHDRTVFEDIRRLRPAELLTFQAGRIERRVWAPPVEETLRLSQPEYIEQFRSLLDEAVASRIAPGVVAAHLSAGWDSNAVTATAARLIGGSRDLLAITSAPLEGSLGKLPRGRFADESGIAAQAAAAYGVRHIVVSDATPDTDAMRRFTRLSQMPVHSPTNVAWWSRIRHLARDAGASTVLSAEVGNLSLNYGGLAILGDLARQHRWADWWREATRASRRTDIRWRGIMINSFGPKLPDRLRDQLAHRFQHANTASAAWSLRPEWRPVLHELDGVHIRPSGNTRRDRWRMIRANDIGPWRLAALADAGIVERDPTADRRVIEFALRLPAEQLFHNGQHRPLARAALADRVPPAVLDARKRGLQSADWHLHLTQHDAYSVLEDMRANPIASDLFDLAAVERTIAGWPTSDWNSASARTTYSMDLTAILATGVFLTEFNQWGPQDKSPRI
jgi:asparagine synthase (glutamine-hydrolysing)